MAIDSVTLPPHVPMRATMDSKLFMPRSVHLLMTDWDSVRPALFEKHERYLLQNH